MITDLKNAYDFKGQKDMRGNFLFIDTFTKGHWEKSTKKYVTEKIQVGHRKDFIQSWQNVVMLLNPDAPFGTILNFLNEKSKSCIAIPKPYYEFFNDVEEEYRRIKTEGIYKSKAFKIKHYLVNDYLVNDKEVKKQLYAEQRPIISKQLKKENVEIILSELGAASITKNDLLDIIEKEHLILYNEKHRFKKASKKRRYIGIKTLNEILKEVLPHYPEVEILQPQKIQKPKSANTKRYTKYASVKDANFQIAKDKVANTLSKINYAIDTLIANDEKITDKKIAEISGLGRTTVNQYKNANADLQQKINQETMKQSIEKEAPVKSQEIKKPVERFLTEQAKELGMQELQYFESYWADKVGLKAAYEMYEGEFLKLEKKGIHLKPKNLLKAV